MHSMMGTLRQQRKFKPFSYTAPAAWSSSDWMQVLQDDVTAAPNYCRPQPGLTLYTKTPVFMCPPRGLVSDGANPDGSLTGGGRVYDFEYRPVAGATVALNPDRPGRTICWPQVHLAPGNYEWRARDPDVAKPGGWSDWRPFTISPDAVEYMPPTADQVIAYANANAVRPRMLPPSMLATIARMQPGGDMYAVTQAAEAQFNGTSVLGGPAYPTIKCYDDQASGNSSGNILSMEQRMEEAWWLWRITGNVTYRNEALRRARAFIRTPYIPGATADRNDGWGWNSGSATYAGDPAGAYTSYTVNDIICSHVLRGCAFALDAMRDLLSDTEIDQALFGIQWRLDEMAKTSGYKNGAGKNLGPFPMRPGCGENSHSIGQLPGCVSAGLMMLNDPRATAEQQATALLWARNADMVLALHHAYQDEQGAHYSGYNYGALDSNRQDTLDLLSRLTGFDMYKNPKRANNLRWFNTMYPGEQDGVGGTYEKPFGDNSKDQGSGGRDRNDMCAYPAYLLQPGVDVAKAMELNALPGSTTSDFIAYAVKDRQWYCVRGLETSRDAEPVNAGMYEGAGYAFLHSYHFDPKRTSLWFRCSPAGGYNHRHCDQNHFVIADQSKPLLMHSGYYDNGLTAYSSIHNRKYLSLTQSKNCIVWGNSREGGQAFDKATDADIETDDPLARRTTGRILRYRDDYQYWYVVGDALKAYQDYVPSGGDARDWRHTKALRAIVVIKPGWFVIFDAHDLHAAVGSQKPSFLFHTVNQPTKSAGVVTINNGDITATLKKLYCNLANDTVAETVDNNAWPVQFGGDTDPGAGYAAQWHNSFNFAAGTTLRLCTFIQVGRYAPASAASCNAAGSVMTASVTINGRTWTVAFDAADGSVAVAAT